MRLLTALVVVVAAGFMLAPTASAFHFFPESGHYTGEADDHKGNRKPVEFDVDFHAKQGEPKAVHNFRFGDHHLGTTSIDVRRASPGLSEGWQFDGLHRGSEAFYRFTGDWNAPGQTTGEVRVTVVGT